MNVADQAVLEALVMAGQRDTHGDAICDRTGCGNEARVIDTLTNRFWCNDHQPDFSRSYQDLPKEGQHGQAEAQERTHQEERQKATVSTASRVLKWREGYLGGQFAYWELFVERSPNPQDFYVNVQLAPRPGYCDRGRWIATVEGVPSLDEADGFARYYMDLARAKAEMEAWLTWRLWKQ